MSVAQSEKMARVHHTQSDILPLKHQDYAAHLFQTASFSDCSIYSRHRVWHLHRCILSPRSEFFWRCFDGDFEEAISSKVEMHDDDPHILEKMLRWIYTMQLSESTSKEHTWTDNVLLYNMADKYGLQGLMEATRDVLFDEALRCRIQPSRLSDSINDYIEAMEMLYGELPEQEEVITMRDNIVRQTAYAVAQHARSFPQLQELIANVPSFGVVLLEHLAKGRDRRYSTSSQSSKTQSMGSELSAESIGKGSPQYVKPYIPLNEDSDEELID